MRLKKLRIIIAVGVALFFLIVVGIIILSLIK
jgi:hypothetical protein